MSPTTIIAAEKSSQPAPPPMTKESLESSLNSMEGWVIFFAVLVAIGVAGAAIFAYKQWTGHAQLKRILESEERELQGKIATAQEEAAAANERAEGLAKEAAEARLALENMRVIIVIGKKR